ncbi:MAG: 2-dehydropantoate 2-reductase N-terminal domain-containing protein, partial [Acidobacteriaceae bacterium]
MSRIAIIGSGAWGTALAISLAQQRAHSITLWSHTAAVADSIAQSHENRNYLPGYLVPDAVQPSADLAQALASAEI